MSKSAVPPLQPPRDADAEAAAIRAALPPEIAARVQSARIVARRAVIVAEAGDLGDAARAELDTAIRASLAPVAGIDEVRIALTGERRRRRLIAVGSGKGGVGKSTLTTNLAVALAKLGRRVGVIDGDIYGPSQPKLLKTEGMKPAATPDGKQLSPIGAVGELWLQGPLVADGYINDQEKTTAAFHPTASWLPEQFAYIPFGLTADFAFTCNDAMVQQLQWSIGMSTAQLTFFRLVSTAPQHT